MPKVKTKNSQPVKLCVACNEVKPLETGYYKAGGSWQKRCKLCHNEKRKEYKNSNTPYKKKSTGFYKLTPDLQEKIKYDIHVKLNFKEIAKKYKDEGLKYPTLLYWKKKGIPRYELNLI